MHNENSNKPPKGLNSLATEEERLAVYQEALLLVKEGKSVREAEAIMTHRHGRMVISYQSIGHKKLTFDGTISSLVDKRGLRCGRSPQFWLDNEPFRLILGNKASGGSLKEGRQWLIEERFDLGIPEAQIPNMNQVYYAVKQTAELRTPEFNRQLADELETAKITKIQSKYEVNQCLAADEIHLNHELLGREVRCAKTRKTIDAYIFLAVEVASGIGREPTEAMKSFDEQSYIAAIGTALKSSKELELGPCAPAELRMDNASFHKTLSILQSELNFQKALSAKAGHEVPFVVRYGKPRNPKSNPHAERFNGIVRNYLKHFLIWFEIHARLKPEEPVYFEFFMIMLRKYIKHHNNGCKARHELNRIQEYNMGCTDDRTNFDDSLVDEHFKFYRKSKLESTGVEINSETHLNAKGLEPYHGKEVYVAVNPRKVGLVNPAYIRSSKKAPLRHIADLIHEEASPDLKNSIYKSRIEGHNRAATADVILASACLARRHPKMEAAYADFLSQKVDQKIKDDIAKQEVVKAKAKSVAKALRDRSATPDPKPEPAPEPTGWETVREEE